MMYKLDLGLYQKVLYKNYKITVGARLQRIFNYNEFNVSRISPTCANRS
jgi:hypothetical protein